MRNLILATALTATLTGCAGRSPAPVSIVQGHDQAADCASLQRETIANVETLERLQQERGNKAIQNGAALGFGLFIWPALLAMDWQGAASKEHAALEQRQRYLGGLAAERCAITAATERIIGNGNLP